MHYIKFEDTKIYVDSIKAYYPYHNRTLNRPAIEILTKGRRINMYFKTEAEQTQALRLLQTGSELKQ